MTAKREINAWALSCLLKSFVVGPGACTQASSSSDAVQSVIAFSEQVEAIPTEVVELPEDDRYCATMLHKYAESVNEHIGHTRKAHQRT